MKKKKLIFLGPKNIINETVVLTSEIADHIKHKEILLNWKHNSSVVNLKKLQRLRQWDGEKK